MLARTGPPELAPSLELIIGTPRAGRRAAVGASVDIGSTSVHLFVAEISGHRLTPLADESVFLRLGDAVHDGAPLGGSRRAELVAALARFADTARRLGATSVTFVGTEPMRRAADGARIVAEVEREAGVPLHVLSHEEEAYLTLIGVLEGRPVERDTLVFDIGGGSSEFILVGPARLTAASGLRLGAARLTGAHVDHDPPLAQEVEAMREHSRSVLRHVTVAGASEVIGVGGTASNLLKVLPAARADRVLTRRRIGEILGILVSTPAGLVSERYLVNPIRARLLPAGAVIVDAIIERHGVEAMRVSDVGIREGVVLAVHHGGPCWRDGLPELARGWS